MIFVDELSNDFVFNDLFCCGSLGRVDLQELSYDLVKGSTVATTDRIIRALDNLFVESLHVGCSERWLEGGELVNDAT